MSAVRELMNIELRVRTDTEPEWRVPGETYSFTSAREGVASSGFGVPIAQVTTALAIMREAFLVHKSAPVVFTCRYAQKSPAMLGFTRFDPTCIIDIDGIETPATMKLIKLAADRLEAAGMPFTQHWGKSQPHDQIARARGGSAAMSIGGMRPANCCCPMRRNGMRCLRFHLDAIRLERLTRFARTSKTKGLGLAMLSTLTPHAAASILAGNIWFFTAFASEKAAR